MQINFVTTVIKTKLEKEKKKEKKTENILYQAKYFTDELLICWTLCNKSKSTHILLNIDDILKTKYGL